MSDGVEELEGTPPGKAPLRPLPLRLMDAIVSPGRMARTVADNPKWLGAMLVSAVLLALSVGLLPYELVEEMQRRAAIQAGRPVPNIPENAQTIIRIFTIVGPLVAFIVMSFIISAITMFVFAFVLGDEGKYTQYLAVGVHAAVIPGLVGLLLIPMRIAASDMQLTINVGTFLPFLPDGFWHNFFRAMDVSQIWSSLVTAAGIHAIDRRRSFGSAAAILLGMLVALATVAGWFLTRQGL
jgi:hypothetical protein